MSLYTNQQNANMNPLIILQLLDIKHNRQAVNTNTNLLHYHTSKNETSFLKTTTTKPFTKSHKKYKKNPNYTAQPKLHSRTLRW